MGDSVFRLDALNQTVANNAPAVQRNGHLATDRARTLLPRRPSDARFTALARSRAPVS